MSDLRQPSPASTGSGSSLPLLDNGLSSRSLDESAAQKPDTVSVSDLDISALFPPSLPPKDVTNPNLTVDAVVTPAADITDDAAPPSGEGATAGPTSYPQVANYEILGELGRGGMGVVYKARQKGLRRLVALKMILSGAHAGTHERDRFRAEAEAVARLQHPNIVQIYEVGEEGGYPFFSLEYVDGKCLAEQLHSSPLTETAAAVLLETLARAIHVAHGADIVHRDLKPANILLTSSGVPKITDFGLAKKLDDASGETRTGAIVGTPSYMAPEQARGRNREISAAADIYALGAIFYECLTGRPPFRAATVIDTLEQLCTQEPVPPTGLNPKVPRDLETICLKCLQKEPPQRYVSAVALADDLRRFLEGEPIHARPASGWERARKWARRRPTTVALIAVSCLALLAGTGLVLWHNHTLSERLDEARQAAAEATLGQQRATLRNDAAERLRSGEGFYREHHFRDAQRHFQDALAKVGTEPALADLRQDAEHWLERTNPQVSDQEAEHRARVRLQQFKQRHQEALFHATLFAGADLAADVRSAAVEADEALKLFGVQRDGKGASDVAGPFYSVAEKTEIAAACFELLLLQAELSASANHTDEALRWLDRAAQLGLPPTQAYHLRRGRYLAQKGTADAARQEEARADALPPTRAFDFFLLGEESFKRGDLKAAMRAFDRTLRLQPDHFLAQYLLAVCYLKEQRFSDARTTFTACLGLRPDFLWICVLRGYVHSELGDFDDAVADFQKVLENKPDPLTEYAVYLHRGAARLRQGRLDDAAGDFQRASTLKPELYPAHVNLALVLQKQGKLDEAVAQLNEAIRLAPEVAELYRNRARLFVQRDTADAALTDLEKALALEPADSLVRVGDHLERGRILLHARRYAEAVQAGDAALHIDANSASAHHLRADALLAQKNYAAAVQAFDQYLKRAEKADAAAYQGRGLARVKLGEYQQALLDYTRARELNPSAQTFALRGWACVARAEFKLALSDFDEAVKLDPKNGYARGGRGYVRAKLGRNREAIADVEAALSLETPSAGAYLTAARTFALAVALLDAVPSGSRTGTERLRWLDQGLEALRKSLESLPATERTTFWEKSVQADPDLKALRTTAEYARLDRAYAPVRK